MFLGPLGPPDLEKPKKLHILKHFLNLKKYVIGMQVCPTVFDCSQCVIDRFMY